jgi:SAM-dependent methyltransferase
MALSFVNETINPEISSQLALESNAPSIVDVASVWVDRQEQYNVQDPVIYEVVSLQERGFDVEFVEVVDSHALSPAEQAEADRLIEEFEDSPNGHEMFTSYPTMADWAPVTKRAIALNVLYKASWAERLSEGIAPDAFDRPLFDALLQTDGEVVSLQTARQMLPIVMPDKPQEKIDSILATHDAFLANADIDPVSRFIYQGALDPRGVRTRATLAQHMVAEHFLANADNNGGKRQDLVLAGLACGAAEPDYDLVETVQGYGFDFKRILLVDQDPMALAAGHSLAEGRGLDKKIAIELHNLLTEKLTEYIDAESVDVADLLGLFEYIPNNIKIADLFRLAGQDVNQIPENQRDMGVAAYLLAQVRTVMKPGGVIEFGNMLKDRPQQKFFSNVVKWPRLQQRTVEEVIEIIQEAGFATDKEHLKIRIPVEGLYAVFELKIPHEADPETREPTAAHVRRLGRRAADNAVAA